MSFKESLTQKYGELILDVKLKEKEQNFFLEITLNEKDLKKITKLSREISILLDEFENELPSNYFLDIMSVGVDFSIEKSDLKKYIGKYIEILTIAENKYVKGILFQVEEKFIILKVNFKGQFRKKSYDIENIKKYQKVLNKK